MSRDFESKVVGSKPSPAMNPEDKIRIFTAALGLDTQPSWSIIESGEVAWHQNVEVEFDLRHQGEKNGDQNPGAGLPEMSADRKDR